MLARGIPNFFTQIKFVSFCMIVLDQIMKNTQLCDGKHLLFWLITCYLLNDSPIPGIGRENLWQSHLYVKLQKKMFSQVSGNFLGKSKVTLRSKIFLKKFKLVVFDEININSKLKTFSAKFHCKHMLVWNSNSCGIELFSPRNTNRSFCFTENHFV